MPRPLRELAALCLMLLPLLASAEEPGEPRYLRESLEQHPHALRHLFIRGDAAEQVQDIYVAGGVATIIQLPLKLHTRGTGIGGGGARRFELLMGGSQIVVTPLRSLADGERFPMLVTLADGTVIPLSLTGATGGEGPDGEVQIHPERDAPEALRAQLVSMTGKATSKEQGSEDSALATLLAGGREALTAFARVKERLLVDGSGRSIRLSAFAPKPEARKVSHQVIAVFRVLNKGQAPLDLSSGRVFKNSGWALVSSAIRAQPSVIPPGTEGRIAVVVDRAEFGPGADAKLTIDLFSRLTGEFEASTDLVPADFEEKAPHPW